MTSALPPDLQQIADAIDRADQEGAAIAARVTDEEFHWKPDDGRRWSIGECLDHLATMNRIYSAAVRTAVDTARRNGLDPERAGCTRLLRQEIRRVAGAAGQDPAARPSERAANTRPEAAMRSCGRTTPHTTTFAA